MLAAFAFVIVALSTIAVAVVAHSIAAATTIVVTTICLPWSAELTLSQLTCLTELKFAFSFLISSNKELANDKLSELVCFLFIKNYNVYLITK